MITVDYGHVLRILILVLLGVNNFYNVLASVDEPGWWETRADMLLGYSNLLPAVREHFYYRAMDRQATIDRLNEAVARDEDITVVTTKWGSPAAPTWLKFPFWGCCQPLSGFCLHKLPRAGSGPPGPVGRRDGIGGGRLPVRSALRVTVCTPQGTLLG